MPKVVSPWRRAISRRAAMTISSVGTRLGHLSKQEPHSRHLDMSADEALVDLQLLIEQGVRQRHLAPGDHRLLLLLPRTPGSGPGRRRI